VHFEVTADTSSGRINLSTFDEGICSTSPLPRLNALANNCFQEPTLLPDLKNLFPDEEQDSPTLHRFREILRFLWSELLPGAGEDEPIPAKRPRTASGLERTRLAMRRTNSVEATSGKLE